MIYGGYLKHTGKPPRDFLSVGVVPFTLPWAVVSDCILIIVSILFNKMEELLIKCFDTHQYGDLMSRFTNDIECISGALTDSLSDMSDSSQSDDKTTKYFLE